MGTAAILNSAASTTLVSGLKQGDYYFKLTVDDGKDVDFDLVKVTYNSNTKVNEINENKVFIYPNPVHDSFTISNLDGKRIDEVQIVDMKGTLIKTISVTGNSVLLTGISQGNYSIKLMSKGIVIRVTQIMKL